MMTLGESVICIAVVPGITAGLAVAIVSRHWSPPWWGLIGAGFVGWILGFIIAGLAGTLIERLSGKRTKR